MTRHSFSDPTVLDSNPAAAPAHPCGTGAHLVNGRQPGNALDHAQAAYEAMMRGPSPLVLQGTELGSPFPARAIDLVELRALLLNNRTGLRACDMAWAQLVLQSRTGGQDWVIGCVGVALPGLKITAHRATQGLAHPRSEDIVSELPTAFIGALTTVDLGRRGIVGRLNWQARRAANRARLAASRETPHDLTPLHVPTTGPTAESPYGRHVDLVLAGAVRQGVLTENEAQIITETRLQRRSCATVAAQLGLSYEALMKRRRRAETRLAAHLDPSGLTRPMSRNRP